MKPMPDHDQPTTTAPKKHRLRVVFDDWGAPHVFCGEYEVDGVTSCNTFAHGQVVTIGLNAVISKP